MRRTLLMLLVLTLSLYAASQQSPATAAAPVKQTTSQNLPADAASREDVLRLFDALQLRKMMDFAFEAGKQQGTTMAQQMWQESFPKQTEEQRQAFNKMMQDVMDDAKTSFPVDDFLNAMVPVYQRHFTRADVDGIIAFYKSPAGQKFLQEQPQMMQESMQVVAPIQQKLMHDLLAKIQARVQNEIDSQRKKSQAQTLKQ